MPSTIQAKTPRHSHRGEHDMKRYKCYTCGDTFGTEEDREEHQYAWYHGRFRSDGEGATMPRNTMGGG